MREHVARLDSGARVDRDVSFVDVSNDSFFVNYKGGAISEALLLIKNAVSFDDGSFEIAEDGECDFDLLCKLAVGGNAVYAHAEHLRVV